MNLFELFVKIGADTTEANKGIDEVGQKTSGLGEKLKSGLATAGKVAVAGVAAGYRNRSARDESGCRLR